MLIAFATSRQRNGKLAASKFCDYGGVKVIFKSVVMTTLLHFHSVFRRRPSQICRKSEFKFQIEEEEFWVVLFSLELK